mgnify:CR=1 FL=1
MKTIQIKFILLIAFLQLSVFAKGDGGPIYILDYRTFFIILSVAFCNCLPEEVFRSL